MTDPSDTIPPQRLRVMQIIATALILGAVIACAACAVLVFQNNGQGWGQQQGELPVVSLLAGFMTLTNAVLSFALPPILVSAAVRRIATGTWRPAPNTAAQAFPTDAFKLLVVRQSTMIVILALLEGAAFFCSVAYVIEGQVYVLTGVAVCLALMLANFPTGGGVRAWFGRQLEAVQQARNQIPAD